jgi:putative hydrolase of the HAD superfamily
MSQGQGFRVFDVDAIVFDAVGTLLHPDPPAAEAYVIVGARHGSRHPVEKIRAGFRAAFAREEAEDSRTNLRTSEAREVQRWRNIVTAVLDDVADPEACFQDLFEHFARPEAWRCDADAGAVLPELARRGMMLGVASNFDQRLRRVMAGFPELRALADRLVISSEVGWRKPAPEFFATVCERFGLPPKRVLLVGDDLRNDYEGAHAAGLKAVLLAPDAAPGVTHVRGLRDLL